MKIRCNVKNTICFLALTLFLTTSAGAVRYVLSVSGTDLDAYAYGANFYQNIAATANSSGGFSSVNWIKATGSVYRNGLRAYSYSNQDSTSPYSIIIDQSYSSSNRSNDWEVVFMDYLNGTSYSTGETTQTGYGGSVSASN